MDNIINNNAAMVMGNDNKEMVEMEKKSFNAIYGFTHGGVFHADDVMATAIIRLIRPNLPIERGFKAPDQTDDIIIYDIGGGEYDHHQRGCEKFRNDGTRYSSVGLIWRDYGWILSNGIDEVWKEVDSNLIVGIDKRDNGVAEKGDEISFGDIIGAYNSNWDEKQSDDNFWDAVSIASNILKRVISRAMSKYKAKVEVKEYIYKYDHSTPYVVFNRFVPWQDYLISDENAKNALFVIFPSLRGGWNIQTIPDAPGSKNSRKLLPENWAGATPEVINTDVGIDDATFCHLGRFIASAKSLDSVKKMAEYASKN